MQEEFEDTKEVIRIRKSKDRQHDGQQKKGQKGVNSGVAVPAPSVPPVVIL